MPSSLTPHYQFSHDFQPALGKVKVWTFADTKTFLSQKEGHFATEQAVNWKQPLAQEQYNLILVGLKIGELR